MSDTDSIIPSKLCTKCGRTLPATTEYFYASGRGGLFGQCRVCYLAHCREYGAAHLAERRERGKRRYAANKIKILEDCRARYLANREKILAQHKAWREAHPGYWKENWEADPERVRVKNANRRARLREAEGEFTREDVQAQHQRQKGKCFYCGSKLDDSRHIDHVIPIALGGTNHPENIVLACQACNLAKNAKHPMDFAGILF